MNNNRTINWPMRPTPPGGFWAVPGETAQSTSITVERLLIAMMVFFLPMNFLRHPSIYLTLADLLAVASLLAIVVNNSLRLRPIGGASSLLFGGSMLLVTGMMLGSLVNGAPIVGLIVMAQYTLTFLILPMIIFSRSASDMPFFIKVFVLSILVMCLHGIFTIHFITEPSRTFVSDSGRLRGFVERENEVACLIAMAAPLLMWCGATRQINRLLVAIALVVFAYAIVLTGSNSGLITFLFSIGIFTVLTAKRLQLILVIAGVWSIFSILLVAGRDYLPEVFTKRVLGALESGSLSEAGTFSHRMDLIYEALSMIDKWTLIGAGADQHRIISQYGHPVHNAYLLIWVEGGFLALMGFLMILAAIAVPIVLAARAPKGWTSAACAIAVLATFMLSINAFAHVYGRFWIAPLVLAAGMCVAIARQNSNRLFNIKHH